MKHLSQKSSSSSSSSSGTLSTRAQRRGSRTTNACEACKKRKTKCSGPSGPCEACQKVDTFCHFNLRLDTRRKLAYKPTAVRERQQYILEGILQVLKHNDSEDVQGFLQLIRSEARPQQIASCLKQNLHVLQQRGVIPTLQVDETDLVSLGLQGLFSHRAGKNTSRSSDKASLQCPQASLQSDPVSYQRPRPPAWGVLQSNGPAPARCGNLSSSDTNADFHSFNNDHNLHQGQGAYESMPVYVDVNSRLTNGPLYEGSPVGTTDVLTENQVAQYGRPGTWSHTDSHPTTTHGTYGIKQESCQANDWRLAASSTLSRTSSAFGGHSRSTTSLQLPMSPPNTPLDAMCLQFRDGCQKMLSSGVPYEQLNNYGKMDCELLFRNRMLHDDWNIPNWACEVVRKLPSMLAETRLAAALSIARFMPFLIDPSSKTLSALPGILRPTELQMRTPHDISVNFIPIPMLRNCLLYSSTDWFALLGQYDYNVRWDGVWGDVGGAILFPAGQWEFGLRTAMEEHANKRIEADDVKKPKAVVCDPVTRRRHITEHFEKCCWTFDNWSVRHDILQLWPDLSGHIRFT